MPEAEADEDARPHDPGLRPREDLRRRSETMKEPGKIEFPNV
jgi:hypothetical protein